MKLKKRLYVWADISVLLVESCISHSNHLYDPNQEEKYSDFFLNYQQQLIKFQRERQVCLAKCSLVLIERPPGCYLL